MKRFAAFLLSCFMLFSMAACGGNSSGSTSGSNSTPSGASTSPEPSKRPSEFRIGFIQDLTGTSSGFGIPMWNYLSMVVDEINAGGGIDGQTQIKLIGYDSGSDPTEAIAVYNRLVSVEKVHAVLGSTVSNEMIAVAPVAESSKIPTLSTALDMKIVTNDDGSARRYNFILQCTSKQQGYATAKYMIEEKGYTDIAVMYNEGNAYTTAITKALIECVESYYPDVKINIVAYGSNETDYSTYMSKAISSTAQALYCGCQFETAEFVTQLRRNGYNLPLYGPNSYIPYALECSPADAEGEVYYATGLDITADRFAESNQAYRDKYGSEIVAQAYQTCDGLYMLIEAFRATNGNTDAEALVDALKSVTTATNQSEKYHFTDSNIPDGVSLYLGHITDVVNKQQETVAEMVVPNEWIS